MFKRRNDITKFIGFVIIGFVIISGCERKSTKYPLTMSNDFNFISNIADSSYVLDTYRDKLTKKLIGHLTQLFLISYRLPKNKEFIRF